MIDIVLQLTDLVSGPAKAITGVMNGFVKAMTGGESSLKDLTKGLDALAPGASEALTAVGGLALGMVALVGAGAAMAIEASEAKEKMTSMFDALGEGVTSGKATIAMLDELGSVTGQTRAQMAPMARDLMAMGITSLPALRQAMLASASASAMMGETGSAAFDSITKKVQEAVEAHSKLKISDKQLASLAQTGVNVADVAAKMGLTANELRNKLKAGTIDAQKFGDALQSALIDKGAGPLAKSAMSLSSLWDRFKESITKLFEDVNPAPFLDALKDLLGIFDQGTKSGQGLKSMVTAFFNKFFELAAKVLPYVKKFFLEIVIVALKLWISLKPVIAKFKELFDHKSKGDAFASTIVLLADSLLFLIGPIVKGISMLQALFQQIRMVSQAFSSASEIGHQFVAGIVGGITDAIPNLIASVKNMAGQAVAAVKNALGIHSPSALMAQMGGHTASGFAAGIAAGTDDVASAAQGMSGGAATGATGAPSGAGAGGKAGSTINVDVGGIHIGGASSGAHALEITEQAVAMIFERVAQTQGIG